MMSFTLLWMLCACVCGVSMCVMCVMSCMCSDRFGVHTCASVTHCVVFPSNIFSLGPQWQCLLCDSLFSNDQSVVKLSSKYTHCTPAVYSHFLIREPTKLHGTVDPPKNWTCENYTLDIVIKVLAKKPFSLQFA